MPPERRAKPVLVAARARRGGLALVAALAGIGGPGCARGEPPGSLVTTDPPVGSELLAKPAAAAPSSSSPRAGVDPDGGAAPRAAPSASSALAVDELPAGPLYEVTGSSSVKIAALARPSFIYEGPDHARRRLGYLEPGMTLERAEQPAAFTRRCKGGWYRTAPRGFVCMNSEWTTDMENPVVVAFSRHARRGEPLPFVYGRMRGQAPFLYARVPTPREQQQTEGAELGEHLAKISRQNQIELAGAPEPIPAFLEGGRVLPKPMNVQHRGRQGPHRGQSGPRSSFALLGIYDVQGRLFGLSTDLDLIALDRLKLAAVSPIHGGVVDDLPAAIPLRAGLVPLLRDASGKQTPGPALEAFQPLSLTGQEKDDLLETRPGPWVSARGMAVFRKRSSFPGWVKDGDASKWIDVSIRDQTLVAYEGRRAVFVARVSTGAGGEGDPETSSATIRGYFRIQAKHVTATMTGDQAESDYELSDVPYVQYFQGGYALHAAFWHERFGHPTSHGCINLAPRDAAWLFEWTEPGVPAAWHGAEANGEGTLVFIH